MHVTVAVCTWNRAPQLDRTLQSMHHLVLPQGTILEILVINNNCTDNTPEIIDKHARSLPVRGIFEPQLGVSSARNASLTHARGDLIAWTDDDVLVHPSWMVEFVRAARKWPESSFFGGAIEPVFEGHPPKWVRRYGRMLTGPYGRCFYGDIERPFHAHEFPFGGNLAVRKESISRHRFSACVGRIGTELVHGDETDFILGMRRHGQSGVWVPNAKIEHVIQSDRQGLIYLWRWFFGSGRSAARIGLVGSQQSLSTLSSVERRSALAQRLKVLLAMRSPYPFPLWLTILQRSAYSAGLFREVLAALKDESRRSARSSAIGRSSR
jgi:glycosyltransferase involved in cell wall biosynthesis